MIELIDSLGNRLVEGDLLLACLSGNNATLAKILPQGEPTLNTSGVPITSPYIKIAAIKCARNWLTKKGSTFRHPYARYYPNLPKYSKLGQYVYKFNIKEASIYHNQFMVKLPEQINLLEFAKKHYSFYAKLLSPEHATSQNLIDFVGLLEAKINDLKHFGEPKIAANNEQ